MVHLTVINILLFLTKINKFLLIKDEFEYYI